MLFHSHLVAMVSDEKSQLLTLLGTVLPQDCFFLAAFKISLSFNNCVVMCFAWLSEFILLGVHWASECVDLCLSLNLRCFQPLFLQIISFSGTLTTHMLLDLMVLPKSLWVCSIFFLLSPFCSSDRIISIAVNTLLTRGFLLKWTLWPAVCHVSAYWNVSG